MKISNKEKIMLGILGVMLIGIGYYNYVYKDHTFKVQEKEEEYFQIEERYNKAIETINSIESKKSDIKILKNKIDNMSVVFYPIISEEHLILELDNLLKNNSLEASIEFENIKSEDIENEQYENVALSESSLQNIADEYIEIESNIKTSEKKEKVESDNLNNDQNLSSEEISVNNELSEKSENISKDKVHQLRCNISFTGTYENLMNFFKEINDNNKMGVNSINIGEESLEEIKGSMVIEIYAIPKINDEINEYLQWDFNKEYGKYVPFGPETSSSNIDVEINSDDFIISVKSINSVLPTITIGKADDKLKSTYIYADNNSVEDVEIELTKENNKYYYKYKTNKESYPVEYEVNKVEFTPLSKNINISVLSENRVNQEDKSGMKLKVINNTDKLVNVNISDDDSNNKRVVVEGDSSKVSVNQK
ncbi:MAG: pilus assembly protein PilO [Paraclostridium bifermentans]|uniref:pilus assembly protein PilO n=1 Tax=Clostridia TaxID=186801 RepID=UPI00241F20E6|nr:pilus assembly protein PilO [Paraclostridium bifermentans]MBS5954943.1 pilus assembly protein PilO [Paraclostridium bifermentans]CAI3579562.1 putative Type IV pilus inner membrane accessory protein PilO [Clostridium neonatale]